MEQKPAGERRSILWRWSSRRVGATYVAHCILDLSVLQALAGAAGSLAPGDLRDRTAVELLRISPNAD